MKKDETPAYSTAVEFLYGLQLFGAHFGLENTFKLAALAGNPQQKLRFIHVAGTNGKGSTCAMLEVARLRNGASSQMPSGSAMTIANSIAITSGNW